MFSLETLYSVKVNPANPRFRPLRRLFNCLNKEHYEMKLLYRCGKVIHIRIAITRHLDGKRCKWIASFFL